MEYFTRIRFGLLYATIFTLPMFMRLNNYLLGGFLLFAVLDIAVNRRFRSVRNQIPNVWPILAFFALAILACLRTLEVESFQYLERYWSLLFLPLVFMADPAGYQSKRRTIFLALCYGCIATLLICYGQVFWLMAENGENLYAIYEPQYVGRRFAALADTHPAYLGLFILTSIVFLLQDDILQRKERFFHILFLTLGLFQLAGRMAILLFLILFIFLLLLYIRQYKWQILVLLAGISLITLAFMNYGSSYMADRLFSASAYTDEKRLERWEVSYDIFRENPIIGVGYKTVRTMRKELYEQRNLPFGREGDYNAHNQFLEYLSTNGAIGGFVYAVCLMYLLLSSLYQKDRLFVFIFAAFIIANMSESMLVRIKGIEYFAIFASLFLCAAYNERN